MDQSSQITVIKTDCITLLYDLGENGFYFMNAILSGLPSSCSASPLDRYLSLLLK